MAQRKPPTRAVAAILPSVDARTGIELLRVLVEKASSLRERPDLQESDIVAWRTTARDYLVRTFGSDSPNVNATLHASGDGGLYMGMEDHEFVQYLKSGLSNKIKILESCIEQLETDIRLTTKASPDEDETALPEVLFTRKVFVVHGHNHGIK